MKTQEIDELRQELGKTLHANPGIWYDVEAIHAVLPGRIPKHYIDRKGALSKGSNIVRESFDGRLAWAYFPPEAQKRSGDHLAKTKHFGHGEGKNHLKLKRFVAANPQSIGLPKSAKPDVEHSFLSPDRADIVFDVGGKRWAAVEIELRGELNTLVGAWQAVKYRLLLCLEHGLDTDSDKVDTVLVAYEIPASTREFCERHNVRTVEIRL